MSNDKNSIFQEASEAFDAQGQAFQEVSSYSGKSCNFSSPFMSPSVTDPLSSQAYLL